MSKYWRKKVEWSPAGAATWTDLGEIHTDSDHSPSAEVEETSSGTELYSGTEDIYEIPVYNSAKEAALRTIMLADDNKVDLRFTDVEDNTEVEEGFSVIVTKSKNFTPRQRETFNARFRRSFI